MANMAKSLRPPHSGGEVEVEGGHDGSVVGSGIFTVGAEGDRFVVQDLIVDLGAAVGGEKVARDQHVVEHVTAALVEQGVAGRFGDGVLDRHQDAGGEVAVAGVFDAAA